VFGTDVVDPCGRPTQARWAAIHENNLGVMCHKACVASLVHVLFVARAMQKEKATPQDRLERNTLTHRPKAGTNRCLSNR
jgi:hypothetical protein